MKTLSKIMLNKIKALFEELKSSKGFTLIELIIAITIIAILSIIAVPRIMDLPQKARIQASRQQMLNFKTALLRYSADNGSYPTTEQGLQALIRKPETEPVPMNYNEGGYLEGKEAPKDPWGRPYMYACPGNQGNEFEIMSYGADGQEGGEGKNADIKSWE